jgi:putative spermidine/putrescine transport system ATP-binding protein
MTFKLETVGLGKRYGNALALAATDLQVREGEFLTLLGPSGSGKTTLLQLISGLVEPTEGRLLIDGNDATALPPGKRGVGLVFQSYALFPHLTVFDNVAYPLRMRGWAHARIASAVEAALRTVRMEAFANRYPRELSGGQQQRIALARCFVYKPQVILLDEPLGALDKKLREHMQLEIRQLHKELGATFIYVTHDQEEALTLSDRICLMNHACVEQIGTPEEIYDRPATRFAADFIGHSNILEGERRVGPDGQLTLVYNGGELPIPPGENDLPERFAVLVRPESARLTEPHAGLVKGTIEQLIFIGPELRVIVALKGNRPFIVRSTRDASPRIGDPVGISWDVAAATPLAR